MRTLLTTCALAMLMLSTTGCGNGETSLDPLPQGEVVYVNQAYLCPPEITAVIQIDNAQERWDAFKAAVVPIRETWIVPPDILTWLLKQAAELRRLREGE